MEQHYLPCNREGYFHQSHLALAHGDNAYVKLPPLAIKPVLEMPQDPALTTQSSATHNDPKQPKDKKRRYDMCEMETTHPFEGIRRQNINRNSTVLSQVARWAGLVQKEQDTCKNTWRNQNLLALKMAAACGSPVTRI
jgi:hypothetical protein